MKILMNNKVDTIFLIDRNLVIYNYLNNSKEEDPSNQLTQIITKNIDTCQLF